MPSPCRSYHFKIEGKEFPSIQAVYNAAKRFHGYNGECNTIQKRLKAGANTWSEVAKKLPRKQVRTVKKIKASLNVKYWKKLNEMAEVIRELDERKAAMHVKS